jgi:NAD(P)-dependent dehydrogenase (short-subunit alcohol dehydrogenase family)
MDNAAPVVVVTGSTRGIGYGLAEAFLARGCRVAVSGREEAATKDAGEKLGEPERVLAKACDVSSAAQLEALWTASVERFGRVDVWINNAGYCNAIRPFAELDAEQIERVVDANVRGTMLGSHVAIRGFLRQGHGGQLFNMEGWGSHGETKAGMTPYCATKLAGLYFTDQLAREHESTPIRIGTLSPGMVVTDSLVASYRDGGAASWHRSRWLFNFVIDPREVVCGWLAGEVLANKQTRAHIVWMTKLRLLGRFLNPRYWRRNPVEGTPLDTL